MSYVVLARKYRPMTFSDLVGQGHVSQTLSNAIDRNRVAHAFLFTGVRGVGKTTSARILAKALNCMAGQGPTAKPCLECDACREITEGRDLDVQEIDGASYNGVDEVRRLQESLPYRPNRDRYKIIIVDEVHMLSNNAWNAFLKTLEEPPAHVKFIFATTEAHKVPITILSRVQRFDFKLIPARQIANRLQEVLAQEGLQAESGALSIIARQAAGSMRDAMSLLDQVIAWSTDQLTEEGVAGVLGVASQAALHGLVQSMVKREAEQALHLLSKLTNQGFEIANLAKDLLSVLRDVVVVATCQDPGDLLDLPDEARTAVNNLAEHSIEDLLRLHQGFSHHFDSIVRSEQPRAALEMTLIRLCHRPPHVPVDDLIERLVKLEKRLYSTSGRMLSQRSAADASPATSAQPAPARDRTPRTQRPSAVADEPEPEPEAWATGTRQRLPAQHASTGTAASASPSPEVREGNKPLPTDAGSALDPTRVAVRTDPAPATARKHQEPVDAREATQPRRARRFEDLSPVDRWRAMVDELRAKDPKLGAFLDHARVHSADEFTVHVSYQQDSVFRSVTTEAGLDRALRNAARKLWDLEPDMNLECTGEQTDGDTVFAADKQARLERQKAQEDAARNHPVVQDAMKILNAKLKRIELPNG